MIVKPIVTKSMNLCDLRMEQLDNGLWEGQVINISTGKTTAKQIASFVVLTADEAYSYFKNYFADDLK